MDLSKKQELADKAFKSEVLTAAYGERFTSLEDVEDDKEINNKWEYLNWAFYEALTNAEV